jgi:hypothetical protein
VALKTSQSAHKKAFWKWQNSRRPFGAFETTSYSDFHATVKLVPSDVRADGTASSAPPLLTMMISCTSLPNALIGPDFEVSVA